VDHDAGLCVGGQVHVRPGGQDAVHLAWRSAGRSTSPSDWNSRRWRPAPIRAVNRRTRLTWPTSRMGTAAVNGEGSEAVPSVAEAGAGRVESSQQGSNGVARGVDHDYVVGPTVGREGRRR
jgi:hypothetical protein